MAEKLQSLVRNGFMTEIDRFLRELDKKRTSFPESRIKEVAKYRRIFAKRDGIVQEPTSPLWKEF